MEEKLSIDCLVLKDELQAKVREEYKGLSDEEMLKRIHEVLDTSDDPVARKWRRLGKKVLVG